MLDLPPSSSRAPAAVGRQGTSHWFLRTAARPDADVVLYCLPHAGGGGSAYREWPARLPSWIDVAAVQLPGRERRISEPLSVDPAAICAAIRADCTGRPYALFGHSMGGLLAFDLARRLSADGEKGPVHLAISSVPHPLAAPTLVSISGLPDEELVSWVREQGGVPDWALGDRQLLELLLPPLRCDSAWMENYVYRPGGPLTCSISVLDGQDNVQSPSGSNGWAGETTSRSSQHRYPGGHFYLVNEADHLLRDLADDLSPYRGR